MEELITSEHGSTKSPCSLKKMIWIISKEVPEPKGDEAKATHKKKLVESKRIIANSIKDHLIPHVSSSDIPK